MPNTERRSGADRREDIRRPRPGRRIEDLVTHDGAHVTIGAFADYLGLHPKTITKWIDAGTLPAFRLGSEIRIRTDDARAFLESCRIHPLP